MLKVMPKRGTRQIAYPTRTAPEAPVKAERPAPVPALKKRLLTVKEAAQYLSVCQWTVRTMVSEGRVPAVRMNRRVLLDVLDLDRFIQRTKCTAAPKNAQDACRPLSGYGMMRRND